MTRPYPIRISTVAFFNATPLLWGLENDPGIKVRKGVPSSLIDDLQQGHSDIALLPVIDYQVMTNLRMLRATGICCDGETLTVRLFAKQPIEKTTVLCVDGDSHTSVALARVILAESYGIRPQVVPLVERTNAPGETLLLIGDKVVTAEPAGYPVQLDLGAAWKKLTGLPFVFAAWMAREGVYVDDLPARLIAAMHSGLANVETLIETSAVPRGWPREIARKYLTEYLKFRIGDRQIEAIRLFHEKAGRLGIIRTPVQPLRFV